MNISVLRKVARPLGALAVTAAVLGVPATAATAAELPTVKTTATMPAENQFCDWDSGYGCAGYGYSGYPSDRDWGYGNDYRYGHSHHRHYRRY